MGVKTRTNYSAGIGVCLKRCANRGRACRDCIGSKKFKAMEDTMKECHHGYSLSNCPGCVDWKECPLKKGKS